MRRVERRCSACSTTASGPRQQRRTGRFFFLRASTKANKSAGPAGLIWDICLSNDSNASLTMRLRFLAVSLVVFAVATGTGFSQTFTGTMDGYYSFNFNKPVVGGQRVNDLRAFDTRDQSFSLNYGELAVDYKPNNVGVHADIG